MTEDRWFGITEPVKVAEIRTTTFTEANSSIQTRSSAEAKIADVVLTPRDLAAEMVAEIDAPPGSSVCDPCMGEGAFYDAFREDWDRSWFEINKGRDFLASSAKVDWCVSNPPFSRAKAWLLHSAAVCRVGFAYILPLHSLTFHRISMLEDLGWFISAVYLFQAPTGWPGFQAGLIVWKKGHKGGAEVRTLRPRPTTVQQTLGDL